MTEIPFWHRLSTRLALLILVVVAVLALATGILLTRGFELVAQGAMANAESGGAPEVGGIVRATIINLVAIFLFTLVGATVFSRTLLTEPIAQLVRGTRALAAGRLGVTLPESGESELGLLARNFNDMSRALAESREHLEQRVTERTRELRALLELSNATALTVELQPLLRRILERLQSSVEAEWLAVFERAPDGGLARVATRGDRAVWDPEVKADAGAGGEPSSGAEGLAHRLARACTSRREEARDGGSWALPLQVRGKMVGSLVLQVADLAEPRRQLVRAFANQAAVALENARLYDRVQEQAAFQERQHLARELHDSVSQALYAIVLGTHTAQRQLPGQPEKAAEALSYVENLAQAGLAEMRALIFELRPESLEEEGLEGVLRKQVEALERRHGLETELRIEGEPELPFATKKVLVRVAQEALHNVVKHAHATRVAVRLEPRAGALHLQVEDDGVGFAPRMEGERLPGHLGLVSMRERLESLGGSLRVASAPGEGTRLAASLPLARPPS